MKYWSRPERPGGGGGASAPYTYNMGHLVIITKTHYTYTTQYVVMSSTYGAGHHDYQFTLAMPLNFPDERSLGKRRCTIACHNIPGRSPEERSL